MINHILGNMLHYIYGDMQWNWEACTKTKDAALVAFVLLGGSMFA